MKKKIFLELFLDSRFTLWQWSSKWFSQFGQFPCLSYTHYGMASLIQGVQVCREKQVTVVGEKPVEECQVTHPAFLLEYFFLLASLPPGLCFSWPVLLLALLPPGLPFFLHVFLLNFLPPDIPFFLNVFLLACFPPSLSSSWPVFLVVGLLPYALSPSL